MCNFTARSTIESYWIGSLPIGRATAKTHFSSISFATKYPMNGTKASTALAPPHSPKLSNSSTKRTSCRPPRHSKAWGSHVSRNSVGLDSHSATLGTDRWSPLAIVFAKCS
ncbi:MAG: hypothetical protein HXS48_05210 [Theionarchaea archaeon]|nr:hypothetical protein [Theionarchaea archaeon]